MLLLLALCFFAHSQAVACATLAPEAAPVVNFVTAESAVIIWDQTHKIEHFIRQASILTASADLGFLVPTPSTPELAEADQNIFEMAAFLGQPKRVPPINYRSPWTLVSPLVTSSLLHLDRLNPLALMSGISDLKGGQQVSTVVAEKDVAGYHATTLAAEDEKALSTWLTANGYFSTLELRAWLKPYIDKKWNITAFKLIKRTDGAVLTTRAIRLSFHTDQPFYPYSEPSDRQLANAASPVGRALRVAILSDQRMTGVLANQNPWPGRLEYAGPSAPSAAQNPQWTAKDWLRFAQLNDIKHDVALPTELTSFIDESNPRPGTADLYLSPGADQSSFRGEAVDFTLPSQDRIIFNRSFADIAALLALIILPAIPLYCAYKVIKFCPEEELNSPTKLQTMQRLYQPLLSTEQKSWRRTTERIVGIIAAGIGIYFGAQFILILIIEITSVFLRWSDTGGNWIWMFAGQLLAALPVLAMSWGVVFCGVNVWRNRRRGAPLQPSNPFYVGGAWQGFMALSSFAAGSVALLAVVSLLYSQL